MKYFVVSKLSEHISETPEGFLICLGVPIARTGEMIYGEHETPLEGKDGKVKIDRSEEEVFNPKTIASFEGKPVTIGHPRDFVDPMNWKDLAKGVIQNVRRGSGEHSNDLLADLLITDSMAISLVKNGLREVSCGYEAEYVQTDDGRGVQIDIIGNHLALVEQGRAGSSYAIQDNKNRGVWKMKWTEKLAKTLGIKSAVIDEAIKAFDEEEKKDDNAKDADKEDPKKEEKKDDAKDGEMSYDELMKVCNALSAMAEKMKPADASSPAAGKSGEAVQKEGDGEMDPKVKEYIDAKFAEMSKPKDEAKEEEKSEDGEEEMEDDDYEESLVGDEADADVLSRAEILAPGLKPSKDMKKVAIEKAYATDEGKQVIDALNGGKKLTLDSADNVDMLFRSASEVLKIRRNKDLSKTKSGDRKVEDSKVTDMSAEKMNEINANFYKAK